MHLIQYPDEFLKRKVVDFDFGRLDPLQISDHMIDLMQKHEGIGLSANQVGIDARIFVMLRENGEIITAINPEITGSSSEKSRYTEGCLSFPGVALDILRPNSISVEFLDKNTNHVILNLDGMDARCFQHELDHLNGVVFTDYASRLRRDLAMKGFKRLKIQK